MLTVNMLEELFAPGSHHTHEERSRLALTLVEAGGLAPDRGPIDLDSGEAVISLSAGPARVRQNDPEDPDDPDGPGR
ncbi:MULTISPECIES: DUF6191 domain-containing protein [unclassified Streptomyces]|uniref:DUF6191 domain-containing protein n=1 Tax=Streptomyces johnsoniae TaxID=3075532 RepID=A0ABU2S0S3_9ACTN|nr:MULTISPECIES: DUF6191 domain-containing protein [unclassified Streptomyces]MDT0442507.1 DUF6191 domain-containing protein [Streptomyces sp. DSM 41886]ONK10153.1 hypothetical protein STBA_08750 [Streptomyces sp. MP131-18]